MFLALRTRSGNDFSCYKMSTFNRRIERRMGVHQIDSLERYARFLQENPQETDLLYKELLIGVTSFFRDPGLFDVLREKAIPQLLQTRPAGSPLRIWSPGCSTGEEAYSLAIVLKECFDDQKFGGTPNVQFFATDIDREAVDKARQGTYSAGIAADVSPKHSSDSSSKRHGIPDREKRFATWWSSHRRTFLSIPPSRRSTSFAAATS